MLPKLRLTLPQLFLSKVWNHYSSIKILKYSDLAVAVASPELGKVAIPDQIRWEGTDSLQSIPTGRMFALILGVT